MAATLRGVDVGLLRAGRRTRPGARARRSGRSLLVLPGQRAGLLRVRRADALAVDVGGEGDVAEVGEHPRRAPSRSRPAPIHSWTTSTPGRFPWTASSQARNPSQDLVAVLVVDGFGLHGRRSGSGRGECKGDEQGGEIGRRHAHSEFLLRPCFDLAGKIPEQDLV